MKQSENLSTVIKAIDYIEDAVDVAANKAFDFIGAMREQAKIQYDEALAKETSGEKADEAVQKARQALIDFKSQPFVQTIYNSVVNPAATPTDDKREPSRDEKIASVKRAYKTRYGIDVWPNDDVITDKTVNRIYELSKNWK